MYRAAGSTTVPLRARAGLPAQEGDHDFPQYAR